MRIRHALRPDPPVRPDQLCAVCRGPRGRLPKAGTQRDRQRLADELRLDPFCSTECARAWHGTTLHGQPAKAPAHDLDWTHA